MTRIRTVAAAAGAAGMVGTFLVVLPTSTANAHGGLTHPPTRTYACYVDGRQGGNGGDLDPTNPMCAAAWQENIYPFWNWFGNLLPDAGGQHQQIIPDGNLCGPGPDFAAFRAAPADAWPTTQLQSGSSITFQYNAWAPHPGTWSQYVTTDNWDPSTPLTWDELEPAPFDEVTDPPIRSGGPEGPEYYWNATLPNKQGQHIIFSVWQRSDSPEAFYNCSDVNFGGGGAEGTDDANVDGDDAAEDSAAEADGADAADGRDAIVATEEADDFQPVANTQLPVGGPGLTYVLVSAVGGLLAGVSATLMLLRRRRSGLHRA